MLNMKTVKDREYSFNHTKERLSERFDLSLTRKEYKTLCSLINKKTLLVKEDDKQEIHLISWKNKKIKAVFNLDKQYITTVLPDKDFCFYF